jgi:hypothetical protein
LARRHLRGVISSIVDRDARSDKAGDPDVNRPA